MTDVCFILATLQRHHDSERPAAYAMRDTRHNSPVLLLLFAYMLLVSFRDVRISFIAQRISARPAL